MKYENILFQKEGHVVIITLNRPQVHNALNRAMALELHDAWKAFREDDDAFVAILTGAGDKAFSAGWDLNDAATMTDPAIYQQWLSLNDPGPCGYTHRVDIYKPTIAAINGYCFAAGLETACTMDIRIASDTAEFGLLERRWNIALGDGGSIRLPMIVGYARALELIITGRRINTREALNIGLITERIPRKKLMKRARELAQGIAALPQGAIRSDKESVVRGWGRPTGDALAVERELLKLMWMRQDKHSEGARAFLEKRKPDFRHHGL